MLHRGNMSYIGMVHTQLAKEGLGALFTWAAGYCVV